MEFASKPEFRGMACGTWVRAWQAREVFFFGTDVPLLCQLLGAPTLSSLGLSLLLFVNLMLLFCKETET